MKAINSLAKFRSSQLKEIQTCISDLTTRVENLVADNAAFRAEISVLRSRIELLKSRPVHSSDSPSMIFRESTERSKIEFNAIAYGVLESAANTAALRFKDDLLILENHLKDLSISVPTEKKHIRLGKSTDKKPKPLKIICRSKNDASQLISNFHFQAWNRVSPLPAFRIVRDKTTLERDLLRKAHRDLERKMDSGPSDLTISYVNRVPTVVRPIQKT
ncbi:unnamed protein product [Macrosiphum euphorbiae]|uniref:Endonuclease-reverse transcriptase n=1 Tax=Macrosiphum euphorbiae TaxID=13131 RepID=A0AAV0XMS9_9HEMI|nr:unnamed protein product [Macrosiphum euphorbiae]